MYIVARNWYIRDILHRLYVFQVTSSLDNVCQFYVTIGTADFQPIEIVVRHGVDDVTYLIREDQIYLRLQPDSTLMI